MKFYEASFTYPPENLKGFQIYFIYLFIIKKKKKSQKAKPRYAKVASTFITNLYLIYKLGQNKWISTCYQQRFYLEGLLGVNELYNYLAKRESDKDLEGYAKKTGWLFWVVKGWLIITSSFERMSGDNSLNSYLGLSPNV